MFSYEVLPRPFVPDRAGTRQGEVLQMQRNKKPLELARIRLSRERLRGAALER